MQQHMQQQQQSRHYQFSQPKNPAEVADLFVKTHLGSGTAAVMDLNTKDGRKQYRDAAVSLFPVTEKHDVESNKFQ
jgi:hypothetical protein